ncbi:MAG: right-handed parallel beta-helix repeat-containing protein, partial [Thermoplasmata archaeon]|nr:right-handed parallel beta-helix repeat-containing protein [Thermoplasmata archaeon]
MSRTLLRLAWPCLLILLLASPALGEPVRTSAHAPLGPGHRGQETGLAPASTSKLELALHSPPVHFPRLETGPRPWGPPSGIIATLTIWPNGTLSNASAPVVRNGSTYRLTANLSAELLDERNGSTIDGAGHTIRGDGVGNDSFSLILYDVQRVTVENLSLLSAGRGFPFNATGPSQYCALFLVLAASRVTIRNVTELNSPAVNNNSCNLYDFGITGIQTGLLVQNSSDILAQDSLFRSSLNWSPPPGSYVPRGAEFDGDQNLTLVRDRFWGAMGLLLDVASNISQSNNLWGNDTWRAEGGLDVTNLTETQDNQSAAGGELRIMFSASQRLLFLDNDFANAPTEAAFVLNSVGVTFQGNNVTRVGGIGLDLVNVQVAGLLFNNISYGANGSYAIDVTGSIHVTVSQNVAYRGAIDCEMVSTSESAIANNTFPAANISAVNLSTDDLITVTGNDLSGTPVPSHGLGVTALNSTRLHVANNTLSAWNYPGEAAVAFLQVEDSDIRGNQMTGSFVGVNLTYSFAIVIADDLIPYGQFGGTGAAVRMFGSGAITIAGNDLRYSATAVQAMGGGDSKIVNNNLSFSHVGITWRDFDRLTISNNVLWSTNPGIQLLVGLNFTIFENNFATAITSCGSCTDVYLGTVTGGMVEMNNLTYANLGVYGSHVGNLTVHANSCYTCGFLALLGEGFNLSITDNYGGSDLEGVELDQATRVHVDGNRFTNVVAGGVRLANDVNGTVDGNIVTAGFSGAFGLELSASSQLSVTNNTLSNLSLGLEVDNSSSLSFASNTLGSDNASF